MVGSSLPPLWYCPPHPKVSQVIQLGQQQEKAVPPWPRPRWFLLTGSGWTDQESWTAGVLPYFSYMRRPVPKAGQGLHMATSGRRDPAWDQRTQCCVSVQKHNLVPMASTTPSSLCGSRLTEISGLGV